MRTQGNFQINSMLRYIKNFKRPNLKLHLPVNRFQMYTSLATRNIMHTAVESRKKLGGGGNLVHVQTWNDIDKQDVKNRMNNYEWNSDEVYWFLFSLVLVTRIEMCAWNNCWNTKQSRSLTTKSAFSCLWNFVAPPIYLSL